MAVLLVRADGGAGIGSGHLSRALALAQAWVDGKGEAVLASDLVPAEWARRFTAEGVALVPAAELGSGADWVVVDGYRLAAEQGRARQAGARVAVVDDHGTVGDYDADVVIDQNLGADTRNYERGPAGTDLLLGPRYALLRRPFRDAEPLPLRESASRLLVGLGGAPPPAAGAVVDAALRDARLAALELVAREGVDDPVALMRSADLAVAGAGTTTWELCRLGVPALLLVLAENQAPVAAAMAAAGAGIDLGPVAELEGPRLADALVATRTLEQRRALAGVAAALVDGRGAMRVAGRLRSALLTVRAVREDDARLLWEWANDPGVRQAAFSPAPIPWEDHLRWFAAKRADPNTRMFVVEDEAGPAAQVRFDADGAEAEIHVSVAADRRGRGLGPAVIDAAARAFLADVRVDRIVARIRPENRPSTVAFGDARFVAEGERTDGDTVWLQYARTRDDRSV